MHVAVIGAGITGLTTAWTLLQSGMEVTLVERSGGPAHGASAQNGAQLSYAFVAPLASPATFRQIPSLLLDADSPLKFRPRLSISDLRWCLQFLLACRASRADRTTAALLLLSDLSRERFTAWRSTLQDNAIEFKRNGKLVVYRSEAALASAERQVAFQAPIGPRQTICSAAECLVLEPALAASTLPIAGGVHTPDEEVADCAAVCETLLREMARHPRFHVSWHTEVVDFGRAGDRIDSLSIRRHGQADRLGADAFVVASGADVSPLLAPLGLRLPVIPLKGYSIELPADCLNAVPRLSITDAAAKVVFAPLGEGGRRRLRVAGMAELVGNDLTIDAHRIDQLKKATADLFGLSERQGIDIKPWAGLRPATPTSLPCIGRSARHSNLFVNAGQGALGFTLAFGSAALLQEDITGASPSQGIGRFFKAGLLAA